MNPPKPTAVKKLHGNPGHRKLNDAEPEAPLGRPEMPNYLTPAAREVWNYLAPILEEMGVLRVSHGVALGLLCMAQARYVEADAEITERGMLIDEPVVNKNGDVVGTRVKKNPAVTAAQAYQKEARATLGLFGLDPSSQSRLQVEKQDGGNSLLSLLRKRQEQREAVQ